MLVRFKQQTAVGGRIYAAGEQDIDYALAARLLHMGVVDEIGPGNYGVIVPKTRGDGIRIDGDWPTFGWRDIIGSVHPKATGVGSPARAVYDGGVLGQYKWVANDVCDFEYHIPHDHLPGSDMFWRVHWSHTGTSITGDVVFDAFYTYATGHNRMAFPAEKQLTITYATTDLATTPRKLHRIEETPMTAAEASAALTARDDIEVDGLVLLTLRLTTLPTIGGGGGLFVHTCDIHHQSTNVGTKQRAPDFYY